MNKIIYNGRLVDAGKAIVSSDSRGLRFGDGCFETMKVSKGKIMLKELHWGRLFSSLELLGFETPEGLGQVFETQIRKLLKKNEHSLHARVRLTIFRGAGALYDETDDQPNYVIESWEAEKHSFNEEGLVMDIYKDARKQADHFSHLKSNNFLPYVMAARWVKAHELDDALLLNNNDRIVEATMSNVFIVNNGVIRTPVLSEGCIAGVMRKYLVNCCRKEGIPVEETTITTDDLQNASEVFLTNAIRGIRWVKQICDHHYTCQVAKLLNDKMLKSLDI